MIGKQKCNKVMLLNINRNIKSKLYSRNIKSILDLIYSTKQTDHNKEQNIDLH